MDKVTENKIKYCGAALISWIVGLAIIYVVTMKLELIAEVKYYEWVRVGCFYFMKIVLVFLAFFLFWFGGNLVALSKRKEE